MIMADTYNSVQMKYNNKHNISRLRTIGLRSIIFKIHLTVQLFSMCEPGAVARSEASSLGMQAAPSSIPTSGTFFRGDLVMKTFLRPFSLFR